MRSLIAVSIFVLALLLNLPAGAQENDSKFFAGVSVGASFPTGKFAVKNPHDTIAGLAMTGPTLSVSAGYMFKRWVGLAFLAGGQENKQDPKAFTDALRRQYGDSIHTGATTHPWKTGRILVGPVFKIPLSKDGKILFQSKILAGVLLKTSVPAYSYYYVIGPENVYTSPSFEVSVYSQHMDQTFCYQVNAGLEYQVSKHISLVSDLSYFRGVPVYKYYYYYLYGPTATKTGPYERKFDISTLNIMAGAQIRF